MFVLNTIYTTKKRGVVQLTRFQKRGVVWYHGFLKRAKSWTALGCFAHYLKNHRPSTKNLLREYKITALEALKSVFHLKNHRPGNPNLKGIKRHIF